MDDTANVLTCYILYRELHCMTLLLASGLSKVEIRVNCCDGTFINYLDNAAGYV